MYRINRRHQMGIMSELYGLKRYSLDRNILDFNRDYDNVH